MNDLVLGVVQNYDWPQLRAYAVSLTRSGFSGTKLLFVNNISTPARLHLTQLGFTLIDFFCDDRDGFIIRGRFKPVVEFLKEKYHVFRYIIWTDVRDVVFQTNPSTWLEEHLSPHKLLGAKECWKIKDEGFNNRWARETAPEAYEGLREEDACCGGTLAGDAMWMTMILDKIYKIVSDNPQANDQGALNYLLRTPTFKEVTRVPRMEEGFAVMAAAFHTPTFNSYVDASIPLTDDAPLFDKENGIILAPNSNIPFSIVHQYDRDKEWIPIIEEKYFD